MKIGEFSLQLINAETREPMKEFTSPDGKVYVAAEPDLEYFIRCQHEKGTRKKTEKTTVRVHVDGTSIGYDQPFFDKCSDLGLWKRENGVSTTSSLMFARKKRAPGATDTSSLVGNVKATFYETIYFGGMVERSLVDTDKTKLLNEAFASAPAVACGKNKAFACVSGSTAIVSSNHSKRKRKRKRGKCLGEIVIHFASEFYLYKLGIKAPSTPATGNSSSTATTKDHDGTEDTTEEPRHQRVKTETSGRAVSPNTSSSSRTRAPPRDSSQDDDDDVVEVLTDPKRKRVKTETTTRSAVSPNASSSRTTTPRDRVQDDARSANVIDLTGDERVETKPTLPHVVSPSISTPSNNMIDLTGVGDIKEGGGKDECAPRSHNNDNELIDLTGD